MQLSDLQTQVGLLTNDPQHNQYLIDAVNKELNNAQRQWNAEVKIIRATTIIPIVAAQRQYALTLITGGTPISFPRVTQAGLDLKKRSKSYFDLYTSYDWTLINGTPTDYYIEATDPTNLFLTVYPNPTANDTSTNIVVESVIDTTDMANATDVPYTSTGGSDYLCRPYDFYLAYSAAARLLSRDPSPENQSRQKTYMEIATEGKELLINVFKQLEADEPLRLRGGRQWQ